MTSLSDIDVMSLTMKRVDHCPPAGVRDDSDDEEEEVDPNLYGEDIPDFGHDEPVNLLSNPPSPSPRIKLEPENTIIERQQSPDQHVNNDSIPLVGEAEPENSLALEDSLQVPKPRKRRQLTPEVLLYTWKDLQKQRQKDFEKIKKMNNPIVKKPKNVEFSLSSLYDRLKIAGLDPFEVTLEPEIRDQPVSRAFMSSVYGGSPQDTVPQIGHAKFAEHGIRYFMYVNASLHTHAPQWPGNPGLFFNSETSWGPDETTYKTFVRLDAARWMYVGDYRLSDAPPLSKEEWNTMTIKVRNAWVNYILKKGWAASFRARVVARRELGRRPTYDEWERVIDEGRSRHITPPDVHAALEAGHERLGICLMKCVGYDAAFQRQIVERFSRWVPPPPKPRGGRRGGQGEHDPKLESDSEAKPKIEQEFKTELTTQTSLKTRKRKRQATPESEAEMSAGSKDSYIGTSVQQHQHFKKKLRRKTVVRRQEDDTLLDDALLGFSDNAESGDDDWRPDAEKINGVIQAQPRNSTQQGNSGTRVDPIVL